MNDKRKSLYGKKLWQKHATNKMYMFFKRMKGNTIVIFFQM